MTMKTALDGFTEFIVCSAAVLAATVVIAFTEFSDWWDGRWNQLSEEQE